MNPNIKVDDEFVKNILEAGGFEQLGVEVTRVDEDESDETEDSKLDEGKKKKSKSGGDEGEPGEKNEETETEDHQCPLCESTLEEAISDERLLEHAQVMADIFDGLEIVEEEDSSDEDEDEEEETEEEEE